MSFPNDPRAISVSFALGDTWRTSSPSFDQVSPGATADDPGPVLGEAVITRGRVGDAAETTPTKVDGLSVRNEDGEYSPDNPYGSNYGQLVSGVPVQLAVDVGAGAVPLATIFADDFVPSWAGPGVDAKVAISGMGVLERIGRLRAARSPLALSILGLTNSSEAPVDYWPMEDGAQAGRFSSAINGGPVLSVTDAELASVDDLPGSGPLAAFTATTALRATLSPGLPLTVGSLTAWAVAWMAKFETLPASATTLMEVRTSGGGAARWTARLNGSTISVVAYAADGSTVYSASGGLAPVPTGEWLSFFMLVVTTSGPDLFSLEVNSSNGSLLDLAQQSGISSVGTPYELVVPASDQLAGMSMGHLFTSGAAVAPSYLTDSPNALTAYDGETAAARIARVCAEIGATATIVNASGETADDDLALGPQPIGTAIDILRNAEDGGEGVLDDSTAGKPRYTTNAAMLNLTAIELDFETHVADLFPLGIERDWRSAVTVANNDTSATVTNDDDTDAPAASLTRNVPDSAVANHAGWLGLIAFLRKPRYVVVLDLRANSAALALMPTDLDFTNRRLTIGGLPVEMVGPGPLDLLVVGTKQRLGADGWVVDCHCEPYGPYRVRQLSNTPPDDDLLDGWLIPDSCSLAAGVDATAASWSVNISPLMTTSASDFPCRVLIGGEEVWVTACSGAASPQTWTVTRSVNGVTKAHSAGAEIELLDPLILTL